MFSKDLTGLNTSEPTNESISPVSSNEQPATTTELTESTPIQETRNNADSSFPSTFAKISKLGIPMAASFTFSLQIFLTAFVLIALSESEEEKAASTLTTTFMSTVCTFFMSPLLAAGIMLSDEVGGWRKAAAAQTATDDVVEEANDSTNETDVLAAYKENIEHINTNSLLATPLLALPASVILYQAKPILTSIFGQDPEVASLVEPFLQTYAIAVPALFTRMSVEQIIFSFKKNTAAMWMALGSLAIGGTISALLGFGVNTPFLEFPRMGARGIAIGFTVEAYLTAMSFGLFTKFNRECSRFSFYSMSPQRVMRSLSKIYPFIELGGTVMLNTTVELAMSFSMGILSGFLGTVDQAAMGYCLEVFYFEFVLMAAFSLSCTQQIKRELGAYQLAIARRETGTQQLDVVRGTAHYGLLTTLIYVAPFPIFFAIFPQFLEKLSGGASVEVSDKLRILVPIMSTAVILDGARYNLLQQLRAFDDLLIPSIIALIGISSGVGVAAALGLGTDLDIYGIGTGYATGAGTTAGALLLRWISTVNRATQQQQEEHNNNSDNSGTLATSQFSLSDFWRESDVHKRNQDDSASNRQYVDTTTPSNSSNGSLSGSSS